MKSITDLFETGPFPRKYGDQN